MLKTERHAKILELISRAEIETQEELCKALNDENFVVTQATVSRDIRDLRLFKVAGIEKKYRYAHLGKSESESDVSEKMRNLFKNCVLSVVVAQNLVVIKTMTGNGANAGAVVDKLNIESVAGSVAGDDTLLIVCRDNASAEEVERRLSDLLR
ncbi:MAG: arginine repressor [Candidatus Scatosoma sp.]